METTMSIDKPSLHWSDKYYAKVHKIISKNDEFNFSGKTSIFHKVPTYYSISWLDFLPLFIGWFHSLFNVCKTYGMIRSSSVFYKPLYKYFRNRFIVAMTSFFITGPILFLVIVIFAPLIIIPPSEYFNSWATAASQFSTDPSAGMATFANEIILKIFSTNAWWVTLILLAFVPCFNIISTFVSDLCMNKYNETWVKLIVLENELKLKLSNFEKSKKKKSK